MARDATAKGSSTAHTAEGGSSLSQIREKELDVDGQVMKARAEAETRIAEAKKRAADARAAAESNAETVLGEREGEVMAEAEREAAEELTTGENEVAHLRELGESRRKAAVDEILKAVLG